MISSKPTPEEQPIMSWVLVWVSVDSRGWRLVCAIVFRPACWPGGRNGPGHSRSRAPWWTAGDRRCVQACEPLQLPPPVQNGDSAAVCCLTLSGISRVEIGDIKLEHAIR